MVPSPALLKNKSTPVQEGSSLSNKMQRRSTLKDKSSGPPTKKNPIEEREIQGDVESKSFFKCCYNRRHQDEEFSEKAE